VTEDERSTETRVTIETRTRTRVTVTTPERVAVRQRVECAYAGEMSNTESGSRGLTMDTVRNTR
jgi:hypothetical protein